MAERVGVIVGADFGGSEAAFQVLPVLRSLKRALNDNLTGAYYAELRAFSIVLRVSGDVTDFGSEGPEQLEHLRKDATLAIDLVVPQIKWRDVPEDQIRNYLAELLKDCFELLVQRALSMGELSDPDRLRSDFHAAMKQFRNNPR